MNGSQIVKLDLTEGAVKLIQELKKSFPDLTIVLDSTSCCSNSNVFVRKAPPDWGYSFFGQRHGAKIFVEPSLEKILRSTCITIDAIEFVDDSMSLETDWGKRLIMLTTLSSI